MMILYWIKQKIQTSWLLHPILLVLFFLIHEINEGHSSEIEYVFIFLAIVLISSLTLFWTCFLWNKNKYLSSYLLTFTLAFSLFLKYFTTGLNITIYQVSILFLLCFVVAFLWTKAKMTSLFFRICFFLNTLFIFLLLLESIKLLYLYESEKKTAITINTKEFSKKPNVYWVMLDGYAKNRNLKKYWNYDNSNFTDSLKAIGFYNIEDSHTNYNYTIETVSSMFSLSEIKSINSFKTDNQKRNHIANLETKLKNDSRVIRQYQERGYSFVNLFIKDIAKTPCQIYPMSTNSIYENTIITQFFNLYPIYSRSHLEYWCDLNRIKKINDEVLKECSNKNLFIYLHAMMAHFPFCLKNNGDFTISAKSLDIKFDHYIMKMMKNEKANMTSKEKKEYLLWRYSYIYHLKKTNEVILPLIISIKKKDPNAIIVLASDHGSRLLCDINLADGRKETFENISYVLFPDRNYSKLNQRMTPTDLMKAIQIKCIGN